MKVYTGEIEVIWSVPGWAPVQRIPAVIYKYTVDDIVGWVDQRPTQLSAGQSSCYLVKNNQVSRFKQSHCAKPRRYKGAKSIRRS